MRQTTPLADLDTLRQGQLQDSLPDGMNPRAMQHAPKGIGQGLIIGGAFLLVIGAWLAIGTVSWPDVLLGETAHVSVPAVKHDGRTPLPTVDVPVAAAGRYTLIGRPADDDLRQLPMLSELTVEPKVEARSAGAGFVVSSSTFEATNRSSTDPHVVYAVPADNPPTRVDVARFVRNLVLAAIGAAALATGLVLGHRRKAALMSYARSIETSLAAAAPR